MNRFTWMWVASLLCAVSAPGCGLVLDTQLREGSGSDAGIGGDTGINGCVEDFQCDDGSVCNGAEHCVDHQCVGEDFILACDDGVGCTLDQCHPLFGCQSTPNDSACDTGLCHPTLDCQPRGCVDARDCGPLDCAGLFECINEQCVRGPPVVCPETVSECLTGGCAAGACVYVQNSRACNDLNNPHCAISECMPNGMCSTPIPHNEFCEDDIGCTENTCVFNGQTGRGTCLKRDSDEFCDDGVMCTLERCAPNDVNALDDGSGCVRQMSDSLCRTASDDRECTVPVCLPTGCDEGVEVLPCLDGGVCDIDTGYCEFSEGCPNNGCADYGSPCAPAFCSNNACEASPDPCVVTTPGFVGYCNVSNDMPHCAVRVAPISILPGGLP